MKEKEIKKSGFMDYSCDSASSIIEEKDRLLSLAQRDIESLKREISDLKQQLNYSKNRRNR